MATWCRKLALLLALTMMPLQGVAATLSILLCHGDAEMHAAHANGGHDQGMHHEGQHDEGGTPHSSIYHLCCNLTVSAPPVVTLPAVLPDFPVRAFVPDALHDLFIPDRPQRPPLA